MTASVWEMCGIWILTSATGASRRFIPWCMIVKSGPDIILVDIDEKEAKHKVK